MSFYHGVIPSNDANGIANGVDSDQTAPPNLSVHKFWIITVFQFYLKIIHLIRF